MASDVPEVGDLVFPEDAGVIAEVGQQVVNGLIIGSTYSLMAAGLTLIFGIMRVVNFAHGEFYMLGGVFAYYFAQLAHVNYFVALALSVGAVMGVGFVCERLLLVPLRDQPSDTTILITIGLSIFLQNMVLLAVGSVPKSIPTPFPHRPVTIGSIFVTEATIFVAVVTIAAIGAVHLLITRTWLGRAMRATFQDRDAALLVGVDAGRIHTVTFTLGSGLAAAAGALLGSIFLVYPSMGNLAILKSFVVVIMGGMGNFLGAIFGGLILGVAEGLGAGFVSSGYKDAIGFVIVILILLFRPSGLFGSAKAR